MEEWRPVKNYEGDYEVSNIGRVKSFKRGKERILGGGKNLGGYLTVDLCKKKCLTRLVHQLVAESFLNHVRCGHKLVINHINFNITDNRLENLEIVTNRENSNKKTMKSSSKYTGVSWSKKAQKWRSNIWINGKLKHLGYHEKEIEASNAYQNELKTL